MRTFAQKPKPTLAANPSPLASGRRTLSGPSHQSNLSLLRSLENSATRRASPAHGQELEARFPARASPRFAHDFSRISVHAPAPAILQTKLQVNTPGDAYEQEADRVAKQVMRMPEPQFQRTGADGGGYSGCQNQQATPVSLQTKRVQASDTGETVAPPIVHEVLRSSGQPLDPATRAFMEPRFGHDFSRVRVHFGAVAEQSAREVNANAYTAGHSIVFGAGRFAPGMHDGRRLIAHELTHVVQQSGSNGNRHAQSDKKRGLSSIIGSEVAHVSAGRTGADSVQRQAETTTETPVATPNATTEMSATTTEAVAMATAKDTAVVKHYSLADSGVVVPSAIEGKVGKVADAYYAAKKADIVITDGERSTKRQAELIYKKLASDGETDTSNLYSNGQNIKEIIVAWNGKTTKEEQIQDMKEAIDKQVAAGKYISNHLLNNAVDVRSSNGIDGKELKKAAETNGGTFLDETKKKAGPHYHISF